jgi:hypothetical protein
MVSPKPGWEKWGGPSWNRCGRYDEIQIFHETIDYLPVSIHHSHRDVLTLCRQQFLNKGKGQMTGWEIQQARAEAGAKNSWRADMRTHTSRVVCSLKDIASRLDARARTLLLFFFVAAGGKTEDWMVLWMPFFDRPGKSSILWQDLTTIAWQRMLYI